MEQPTLVERFDAATPELTVTQLTPGDRIAGPLDYAIVVSVTQHPLWPALRLVTWRLIATLEWTHDALSPNQVVGRTVPSNREGNLRWALLGHTLPKKGSI